MDSTDYEILKLLIKDCRITYRSIGEELGLSGQTISHRINQMLNLGAIISYSSRASFHSITAEEFFGVLLCENDSNLSNIINTLLATPYISRTVFCENKTIFFTGCIEEIKGIQMMMSTVGHMNRVRKVSIHLSPRSNIDTEEYSNKQSQILPHLINDPRIGLKALAEATSMNVKTVRRHLKHLREQNLVKFSIDYNLSVGNSIGIIIRTEFKQINLDYDLIHNSLHDELGSFLFEMFFSAMQPLAFLVCAVTNIPTVNQIDRKLSKLPFIIRHRIMVCREWKYSVDLRTTKLLRMVGRQLM